MQKFASKHAISLGAIFLAIAIGMTTIQTIYAQVPDKDRGASTFAPKEAQEPPAGGWMPMERPPSASCEECSAAEDNPGKQGIESEIIGPD